MPASLAAARISADHNRSGYAAISPYILNVPSAEKRISWDNPGRYMFFVLKIEDALKTYMFQTHTAEERSLID